MKPHRPSSRLFPFLACGALWLAGLTCPAQIPGLPPLKPASATPPAEAPKPAPSDGERLKSWIQEARESLDKLPATLEEGVLPVGITATELSTRRRNLEQTILTAERAIKSIDAAAEAKAGLEQARAAGEEWKGFPEEPPYSLLLLDELLNQREAAKEKEASHRSSILLFQRSLASLQDDAKTAEENARKALAAVDTPNGKDPAAVWRHEMARNRARFISCRSLSLDLRIATLKILQKTAHAEVELLDRKIAVVRKNHKFDESDLEQIRKASEDREKAISREITAMRRLLQEATSRRDKLRAAPLPTATPEDPESQRGLELARLRVEAAEVRAEACQYVLDMLENLLQLERQTPEIYQIRYDIRNATSEAAKEEGLRQLASRVEALSGYETVTLNEIATIHAEITRRDAAAASLAAEDPRLPVLNELRAALWDRQSVLQRIFQNIAATRKQLNRWLNNYNPNRDGSWSLGQGIDSAAELAKRIWEFEVYSYDDTVELDGVRRTVSRGVPLGTFLGGLLFFVISYLLSSWILRRARLWVVSRGYIGDAQSMTLRNWVMIFVAFLLVVGTLHFLNIPLTVFAFFGGALVIGLGFGTQTLIKNFISGIIVLFERKIRVGDIVEVQGFTGTVTEVNTRSSVLRNADGLETLVPNSLFLENRVTNLTLSNRTVRREILVGVAYGTPPAKVIEILREAAERHGLVLKDPPPVATFEDFGDNALLFALRFWIRFDDKTVGPVVASDLRIMIAKRLDDEGIGVPFPQRDVHLSIDQPLPIVQSPPPEQNPPA